MIYFISALAGVFAGQRISFNFYIMMFLILISFIAYIYIPDRNLRAPLLAVFIFLSSSLNTYFSSQIIYADNEYINDVFTVKSVSENRYILKNRRTRENFSAYMDRRYGYGDVLKVRGNVKLYEGQMNEGGADIYRLKKSKGISCGLKVISSEKIGNPSFIKSLQGRFINHTEEVLSKYLKGKGRDLMKSVILADRRYIDDETAEVFDNTGLSHILALSGLHIMVIVSFFDIMLSFFSISKVGRRAFSLGAVGMYIYFVGAPAGAVRSFVMTLCLYTAFLFKFRYDSFSALFISGAVNIFINPYCIYSMSFILSYLSVLSILILYRRIGGFLPENYAVSSLVMTFSAGVLIFPVSQYMFYSFSVLGFLSNLVLVPMYSLAVVLSFMIIVFSFMGFVIAPFLNLLLGLSDIIISFINRFSFLNISFKVFTLNYLVIYYVIIFIILKRREMKWLYDFRNVIYAYSVFAVVLAVFSSAVDRDVMKLSFIYVDQGDCSVIEYRNRYYLVDTGGSHLKNYSPGRLYTLRYLRSHGIYNIDGLFVSHFDCDHIEGVLDIADYTDINRIYVSYADDNNILNELIERGYDIRLLKKGDYVKFSEDAGAEVLGDADLFNDDNDKSLVLGLNCNGFRVLYTGDISSDAESAIDWKCNLLKISHHGSKYSTDEEFLERVCPDFAVISCGIDNMYSHPDPSVVRKLDDRGIRTFITASDGEVQCSIGRDSMAVSSFVKRDRGFEFYFKSALYVIIIYLLIYRTRYLWTTKIFTERF